MLRVTGVSGVYVIASPQCVGYHKQYLVSAALSSFLSSPPSYYSNSKHSLIFPSTLFQVVSWTLHHSSLLEVLVWRQLNVHLTRLTLLNSSTHFTFYLHPSLCFPLPPFVLWIRNRCCNLDALQTSENNSSAPTVKNSESTPPGWRKGFVLQAQESIEGRRLEEIIGTGKVGNEFVKGEL